MTATPAQSAPGDLGVIVAQAAGQRESVIEVRTQGFVGRSPLGTIAARWTQIASVRRSLSKVNIYGYVKSYVFLTVSTLDGQQFSFEGRDDQAAAVALLLSEGASPAISARLQAELDAGREVGFGAAVRLDGNGLSMRRRGSWVLVPYDRIAGWSVTQGHLLVDEDPAKPKLALQIALSMVDNADTLLALLARKSSGRNLNTTQYAVPGSMWRPSAATHDPRYVTTRTRLIGLVVVPGVLLLLVAVGAMVLRVISTFEYAALERQGEAAGAMAQTQLAKLVASAGAPPTVDFAKACAAQKIDVEEMIVAFANVPTNAVKLPATTYVNTNGAGWGLPGAAPASAGGSAISLGHVKYLLLAKLAGGARVDGPGIASARAHLRLVDVKGTLLCEGVSAGWWSRGDLARGTEFDQTIATSGLMKLALQSFCVSESYGACKDVKASSWSKYTVGDPPPPTAPSAAPTVAVPPKKKTR